LGFLHFNNTGKRRYFERAKLNIEGFQYLSTSQDITAQMDNLVLNRSKYQLGYHKVNSYHIILLRMFILELFIRYIKRLPLQKELEINSYQALSILSGDIEHFFKNCEEAILNRDTPFIFKDEKEKNKIIFYDEPFDEISKKYNVFKNTYLQELFLKLYNP
jgi:hypothetical protein